MGGLVGGEATPLVPRTGPPERPTREGAGWGPCKACNQTGDQRGRRGLPEHFISGHQDQT